MNPLELNLTNFWCCCWSLWMEAWPRIRMKQGNKHLSSEYLNLVPLVKMNILYGWCRGLTSSSLHPETWCCAAETWKYFSLLNIFLSLQISASNSWKGFNTLIDGVCMVNLRQVFCCTLYSHKMKFAHPSMKYIFEIIILCRHSVFFFIGTVQSVAQLVCWCYLLLLSCLVLLLSVLLNMVLTCSSSSPSLSSNRLLCSEGTRL